ncbi:DNA-binding response regulator [Marinobacter fuscus]|uniref:DNA-binding response regulator n=1 Tax=Marinobacter fuscus TaxID=2109942 RepID=A0A2T1K3D1_9GAMM|nr:response regulator [Marinobacter fuscus]PSF04585.1 DNA-binding response regulator [Marinobacter fuscus]
MTRKVLIIEDNPGIAELVQMQVADLGMQAVLEARGDTGLSRFRQGGIDLVVLDLMLPGLDGLSVCREIRAGSGYVPVLMLTAKSTELDRVLGLEMGADDYLTKPFSVAELPARIKALFRRVDALAQSAEPTGDIQEIEVDGLRIDPVRRRVFVAGQEVDLTAREFYQAADASRMGHVGLGLAIAHRLVALQSGALSVSNADGAVFSVWLPLAGLHRGSEA